MAENFAVIRMDKIKTLSSFSGRMGHNHRQIPCPFASKEDRHRNIVEGCSSDEFIAHLPEKRRKDAVLAFEVVLSASPEFFDYGDQVQLEEWIEANRAWLNDRYPGRLKSFVVHLDEKTPHIHAMLSTLDSKTGSLNYKSILPARNSYAKLQDDYSEAMKRFGLRRGIRGSKSIHERPVRPNSPDSVPADLYRAERSRRRGLECTLMGLDKRLARMEKQLGFLLNALGLIVGRRLCPDLSKQDLADIREAARSIAEAREASKAEATKGGGMEAAARQGPACPRMPNAEAAASVASPAFSEKGLCANDTPLKSRLNLKPL
jgi:hypothetical protein